MQFLRNFFTVMMTVFVRFNQDPKCPALFPTFFSLEFSKYKIEQVSCLCTHVGLKSPKETFQGH
jgi:hypothetical protein